LAASAYRVASLAGCHDEHRYNVLPMSVISRFCNENSNTYSYPFNRRRFTY